MTMHIEGPWLSTTGKRKGKRKFRNAEEARKARELEESWNQLQKKWSTGQEKTKARRVLETKMPVQSGVYRRDTGPTPCSLNKGIDTRPATMVSSKVYTGSAVLGISTLHKSNAIPVFSKEEAVSISKMRR